VQQGLKLDTAKKSVHSVSDPEGFEGTRQGLLLYKTIQNHGFITLEGDRFLIFNPFYPSP
jgi:hypothetical protein